mmetsp:Transcript_7089/g.10805  ORF Transcript_7089/g.10805 Transcript_7089/m.10805 type:complete len:547 (+) Transcript_7089:144-1784(+)|eukprot:CAMPEP_0203675566 /NCGR_PEP_ID=MMETSP0090-20130426/21198_1 /ASSEMBLY_ACC=CAM_ASM_001088 /TAXON_ID=426623 /ORGANISM="Chaetoceros affinis, Strain CCMP159" /LENGTH=546 /DNA_ID=CAMNT_0050541815 /DNA_START=102 /DNA_END=1742 /DNA_ORIENTATION=+
MNVPTAKQFIVPPEQYTELPPELKDVDFTERVSWRKFQPYSNRPLSLTPPSPPLKSADEEGCDSQSTVTVNAKSTATFPDENSPALEFHVNAVSGRARATTLHLPKNRSVPTPIFMPVGTKGTIKALTTEEIQSNDGLNCPIILGNTYHLALQPGTEIVRDMGGLHSFMNWEQGGILTDSGGFQMVSLLKLAEITEEGVTFENPFEAEQEHTNGEGDENSSADQNADVRGDENVSAKKLKTGYGKKDSKPLSTSSPSQSKKKSQRMLLRPEDSITHQNNIGSDIMMALDDVVSSVADDDERFKIATYRTLRWLDRCFAAHNKPKEQNLFAIVQGGLDVSLGGLREQCLAGFMKRDKQIPGYAIGGLAGGESKDDFWKVVDQCCKALPDDKPRYLMGVGYPLDLVVCTALGVDMYDCVYPTRTARFGVALVRGGSATMRLKSNEFFNDHRLIMEGCQCQACAGGYTRARLHTLLKRGNPVAATLMTSHNIAYMMYLVRGMRKAIIENRYNDYVIDFINDHFPKGDTPKWVRDALSSAGIDLKQRDSN